MRPFIPRVIGGSVTGHPAREDPANGIPGAVLPIAQTAAIALALLIGWLAPLGDGGQIALVATIAFLLGGLPHGAFDIHLAAGEAQLGYARLALFTGIYVALFAVMMLGWHVAPAFTLTIFLVTAILHFSGDWPRLALPMRFALGFAPVGAIALGHPARVDEIFTAMAGAGIAADVVAALTMAGPLLLIVALVGLYRVARIGEPRRAGAFIVLIASLFILPPLVGFTLFFCVFHSPRHLVAIRRRFSDWSFTRFVVTGGAITVFALGLGVLFLPLAFERGIANTAGGFQLLAALAMPHQSVGPVLRAIRG